MIAPANITDPTSLEDMGSSIQNQGEEGTDELESLLPRGKDSRIFTRPFINVLVSATAMCLVYSAFFPGGGLLDIVIDDANKTSTSGLNSQVGYISQGITYILSILFALTTPIAIDFLGTRVTLSLAAAFYAAFYVGIIFLKPWTIYLGSVIEAIGMGWLWVVAPKILTDNSTEETLQRNNSVWWCIYIFSMTLGNLANYFYLGTLTEISTETRVIIYIICCGFVAGGAIVGLLGYRNIEDSIDDGEENLASGNFLASRSLSNINVDDKDKTALGIGGRLRQTLTRYKLALCRKEVGYMQFLLVFNALSLAFYSMIYTTCIGNVFSQRRLIPLMQLVFGITEVFACLLFERLTTKISNKVMSVILYALMMVCVFIIFLMFPKDSTMSSGHADETFVEPSSTLVLVVAALLALSDAGFNIIANSSVGVNFEGDSEVGFTMLNAMMSFGTGTIFFISSQVDLYWIIGMEVLFGTAATLCIVLNAFRTCY